MIETNPEALLLRGLNGANPLGFLAALGTLRVLTRADASLRPQMAWQVREGAWRPGIQLSSTFNEEQFAHYVVDACDKVKCDAAFDLGDDLSVSADAYRTYASAAAHATSRSEFIHAEFAACFASEILVNENGAIQDTALRTMSGAGHQHFLKTMRGLVTETRASHIEKALFRRWSYDDPVRNMSLRWDPIDDSRYALRWSDPSGDPERQRGGAMWGANRLAIEGLPLLPVMPATKQLETTGFRTAGSRGTFWTWPIWETPIGLDEVRSLVALRELQADRLDRLSLSARGVAEVFRSQRLTVGKFRNFSWGIPAPDA
jgi:hypothetical protein